MKFRTIALALAALVLAAPGLAMAQRDHWDARGNGPGGRGRQDGWSRPQPGFGRPPAPGPGWRAPPPGPAYGRNPYNYMPPSQRFNPPSYAPPYYAPAPRYMAPPRYNQAPYGRAWRRGDYLPPAYRGMSIPDYERFHLRRPPQGYYWCRSGDDFILVSAASGLIFEVINGDE